MIEPRRITKKLVDGEYVEIDFSELRTGDKFTLTDVGVDNPYCDGTITYIAECDPYTDKNGVLSISCSPIVEYYN